MSNEKKTPLNCAPHEIIMANKIKWADPDDEGLGVVEIPARRVEVNEFDHDIWLSMRLRYEHFKRVAETGESGYKQEALGRIRDLEVLAKEEAGTIMITIIGEDDRVTEVLLQEIVGVESSFVASTIPPDMHLFVRKDSDPPADAMTQALAALSEDVRLGAEFSSLCMHGIYIISGESPSSDVDYHHVEDERQHAINTFRQSLVTKDQLAI